MKQLETRPSATAVTLSVRRVRRVRTASVRPRVRWSEGVPRGAQPPTPHPRHASPGQVGQATGRCWVCSGRPPASSVPGRGAAAETQGLFRRRLRGREAGASLGEGASSGQGSRRRVWAALRTGPALTCCSPAGGALASAVSGPAGGPYSLRAQLAGVTPVCARQELELRDSDGGRLPGHSRTAAISLRW